MHHPHFPSPAASIEERAITGVLGGVDLHAATVGEDSINRRKTRTAELVG
jgi:hypothetical protein